MLIWQKILLIVARVVNQEYKMKETIYKVNILIRSSNFKLTYCIEMGEFYELCTTD